MSTIPCNGCGAKMDGRDSYAVYDERVCSAECAKRILLRDYKQATDRLAADYSALLQQIERVRSRVDEKKKGT